MEKTRMPDNHEPNKFFVSARIFYEILILSSSSVHAHFFVMVVSVVDISSYTAHKSELVLLPMMILRELL